MNAKLTHPASAGSANGKSVFERLEREIHGLLVDLGLDDQRTDEFIDQEDVVKRFMKATGKLSDTAEEKVIKQIGAGKTEVSF